MTWIILFLLLCNFLTPLAFVLKQCTSGGKIEFNHILLFSVGYVVYWILPPAIGESHLFLTLGEMSVWYGLFDRIPQATVALYLLMCFGIYAAFCAGVLLCKRIWPGSRTDIRRFFFDRRFLNVFLLLGGAAASVYVVVLRNDFFRGYTASDLGSNLGPRGSFIAISVFLFSLAILYSLKQQEIFPGISFRRAVSHHFFGVYFLVAILGLSLGGRLYFFSSLLMLLVYRSVYFQKVGYRPVFFFVVVAAFLSGIFGTLRLGGGISVSDVLFNLVSEPLFNSFSLLQFLIDGRLELVNVPIFLLGDLINLLPTAIFPQKTGYLLSPEDYGYHIFSPLGSLSSFFSFMVNFGFLGTMLFIFLMAFSLQSLRSRGRSLLSKTIYIMVSGWLATTFFRDPFSISLVKSVFQYSILFPSVVVFTAGLVTVSFIGRPERRAVPTAPEG